MAEFPAMPLYTDAYIADTQHLTNEEHGVYLRLLMFAWRTPDCSLPSDDKRLAIMVGVTPGKWAKLKPSVMAFWDLEGDTWKQKKLTKTRSFVEVSRSQKSLAGKASAEAKRLKTKEAKATAVPTGKARRVQQTKTKTKIEDKSSIERDFEKFWEEVPRKEGKLEARIAYEKAVKKSEPDTIFKAMRSYARLREGQDRKYTKTPAAWLNKERWADEIAAPTKEASEQATRWKKLAAGAA